jgi:hypothetical protein
MSRALAGLAILAVPLVLTAAPRLRTPDPAHPVGKWRITFTNGVIETCEIGPDGSASEAEPLRSSPGRWTEADGAVVVRFSDDRLERWKKVVDRWQVEHWCPSAAYPAGKPVVGIARRES